MLCFLKQGIFCFKNVCITANEFSEQTLNKRVYISNKNEIKYVMMLVE